MLPLPAYCDVALIGGGPAASIAALYLARHQLHVVQLAGLPNCRRVPWEVLNPQARLILQQLGLASTAELGVPCRGVVRRWEADEADFSDFTLFSLMDGRSIDRRQLHQALAEDAALAGALQFPAKAVSLGTEGSVKWRLPDGVEGRIEASWVLVASGKTALARHVFGRNTYNYGVALEIPWRAHTAFDVLLVEAVCCGWWYAPPAPSSQESLVFVTDPKWLPRSQNERLLFIEEAAAQALLLTKFGEISSLKVQKGLDAHSGEVRTPIVGRSVAIGDAALAPDPLSGSGIQCAIEGALAAAGELLANGSIGSSYLDWLSELRNRQSSSRRKYYGKVQKRFPNSEFWRARVAADVNQNSLWVD